MNSCPPEIEIAILDSERRNFKLFGLIYSLYLRKFKLFGARLLKKRAIGTFVSSSPHLKTTSELSVSLAVFVWFSDDWDSPHAKMLRYPSLERVSNSNEVIITR